jgi:hypothetical protein
MSNFSSIDRKLDTNRSILTTPDTYIIKSIMICGHCPPYWLSAIFFRLIHQPPADAELAGLKRAAAKLDAILQAAGITEDTLVTEFRKRYTRLSQRLGLVSI